MYGVFIEFGSSFYRNNNNNIIIGQKPDIFFVFSHIGAYYAIRYSEMIWKYTKQVYVKEKRKRHNNEFKGKQRVHLLLSICFYSKRAFSEYCFFILFLFSLMFFASFLFFQFFFQQQCYLVLYCTLYSKRLNFWCKHSLNSMCVQSVVALLTFSMHTFDSVQS